MTYLEGLEADPCCSGLYHRCQKFGPVPSKTWVIEKQFLAAAQIVACSLGGEDCRK